MVDSPDGAQRRRHFRLPYPTSDQPVLEAGDVQHRVIEIAEGGIRVILKPSTQLQLDEEISGVIQFRGEHAENVSGHVLRIDIQHVVVQLDKGISQQRVMQEQAYLRKKYPNFLRNPRT
ncbi:hypothetical protein FHR99_001044 [Litorivivens lipolytica]|uniref:PilZ domain-containing protein n=1 Tax=Litorivivens lipolytica TaxID=1524264 RepID=A0A7W4W3J4_9GAMM|nr:PilZ domain-containing protein [Litorivivens lipolytica]MBB3046808.1 hypothetical protein [Litorivivens lipolytica]